MTIRDNNFFFRGLKRLKQCHFPLRRQLLLIFGGLLAICILLMSVITWQQVRSGSIAQAESLGVTLTKQTAEASASLLVTGDNLSLNVLLSQLVQEPYVLNASIYSVDNLLLARAGQNSGTDSEQSEATYSHAINYQDVVAGHVRIQLDIPLLMEPAKQAGMTVLIVGIVMLLAGLIIIDSYGRLQHKRLRRLDMQLQKIYGHYSLEQSYPGDELNHLIHQLEKAEAPQAPEQQAESVEEPEQPEEYTPPAGAVVAIRLRNLSKLQKLITPYELMSLLKQQLPLFERTAKLYSGTLEFSPEGHAYILFKGNNEALFRAACCGLLIKDLLQQVPAVAHLQLGIGISFDEALSLMPGDQHPALQDNNACIALHLAEQNEDGRPYLLKAAAIYLPQDKTVIENVASTDNIRLLGLSPDYAELMARQKQHLLESLKISDLEEE
ncbi:AhpA/YtjB family protein [Endozoicomonadaceae bacterium StTr2]